MKDTGNGCRDLEDLPQFFRKQAETLREFGAVPQAQALEWAASEVEKALALHVEVQLLVPT